MPATDRYEVEYWARQVRLTAGIAAALSGLAVLRVVADWSPANRWAAAPVGVIAAAHTVLLGAPWDRIVRSATVRQSLVVWYGAALAFLFVFNLFDSGALALYPAGAVVIIIAAAALFRPWTVMWLGVVGIIGYAVLSVLIPHPRTVFVTSMFIVLCVVLTLCVKTAANRRWQDIRRAAAERRTEALLENGGDGVLAVTGGDVLFASASIRRILGYEPDWLTAERLAAITHSDCLASIQAWIAGMGAAENGHTSMTEVRCRRADGTWIDLQITGTNRMSDPDIGALVFSFRDITAQKSLESQLTRQAFLDPLTGLSNRAHLHDRMEHALARHRRDHGRVALLLVDLDDFKLVNDTLGHTAGDELIAAIGSRMSQEVRAGDTVARLGGDEFAVLVEDADEIEVASLAERLQASIRRPVRVGSRELVTTASIGIAEAKLSEGWHDGAAGELLRDADLAMYAAKGAGRDCVSAFDPEMYAEALLESSDRTELEEALAHDEFVLHYQPIVDLPSGRIIGVEALIRWQHPRRGLLGPAAFITRAETTGLIVPIGGWVLRRACEQLARWCAAVPAAGHLRMSINLSARQFQYANLVADVRTVLNETGVNPRQVVLEITESLLMQDTDATIVTLQQLRALGVQLAIDDFGTGYSSLSYLKRFPIEILKIDKSFVDGVADDPEDSMLAGAIVQLGRGLRLQTVAEGIETERQRAVLQESGCTYGQGYLFSRPIEPCQIESMLNADHPILAAVTTDD